MPDPVTTETPNVDPATVRGTEEYNQAMAARGRGEGQVAADDPQNADGTPANTDAGGSNVPAIPQNGHDKFYNKDTGAYDWANHAKEAEYRLDQLRGQKSTDPAADAAAASDDNAGTPVTADAAYDSLLADITATGAATPETVKKFVDSGMTQEAAERAVSDASFRIQSEQGKAFEYVGGKDVMAGLLQWAETNLTEAEKDFINDGLNSAAYTTALDTLMQRKAASGSTAKEGNLTSATASPNAGVGPKGYTSRAQMSADMRNPEYKTNAAFRAEVAERMRTATYSDDRAYDDQSGFGRAS